MEIDDINYDIDNVDIEEEMQEKDIRDEEEEELERIEEQVEQEAVEKYKKSRTILNSTNLDIDLKSSVENDRAIYTWCKKSDPTISFTGYVVYKFDSDAYIFNIATADGRKSRKFRLSEIQQLF